MAALSYTSVEKMLETLPSVGSVTSITSSTLYSFAWDAETIVNAKLSKLYVVPVVGAPPVLAPISTDIALYRLLTRRIFTQEQLNKSDWPDRYKESMDLLDKIASGEVSLVSSGGAVISGGVITGEPWSNTLNYSPTFQEDSFESSVVDPDKLDSIVNGRM